MDLYTITDLADLRTEMERRYGPRPTRRQGGRASLEVILRVRAAERARRIGMPSRTAH